MSAIGKAVRSGLRWLIRNMGLIVALMVAPAAVFHLVDGQWLRAFETAGLACWPLIAWLEKRRADRAEAVLVAMMPKLTVVDADGSRTVWQDGHWVPEPGKPL